MFAGFCSMSSRIELVFLSVFSGCIFCLIGYSANRLPDKDFFPVGGLPWVLGRCWLLSGHVALLICCSKLSETNLA